MLQDPNKREEKQKKGAAKMESNSQMMHEE